MFYVLGTDANGCSNWDSVFVQIIRPPHLPTAFTPDDNGLNDLFKVERSENYDMVSLEVFNRWGELIFRTTDINEGWDGTYNGIKQPIGTYVYVITGIDAQNFVLKRSGNVTLIR
jgi:gliding motility-associated-like protein